MAKPDRPEQLPLEGDPILDELNADDLAVRRCQGWTRANTRCRRTAPPWWPALQPWKCPAHRRF